MTVLAGVNDVNHYRTELPIEQDEQYIRTFADQMLSRRVFKGVYSERRLVEPLKQYRDLIVLNSTGNEELIKDLIIVKKRLREFYGPKIWIGVTDPNCMGAPAGYCLWLKPWNKPLGEHEFCIKRVEFIEGEICLSVKSKRFMDTKSSTIPDNNLSFPDVPDPTQYAEAAKEFIMNSSTSFSSLFTKENILAAIKYFFIFAFSSIKFLLELIKYLGEFTIRFTDKFNNFVYIIMPLLLAIIELLQKTIGGMYLLCSMVIQAFLNNHVRRPEMPRMNNNPQILPPNAYLHPSLAQQRYSPEQRYSGQMPYRRQNSQQRQFY